MLIPAGTYNNFKVIISAISMPKKSSVFEQDFTGAGGLFYVFAVLDDSVVLVISLGSKPATFDADFPSAVALEAVGSAIAPNIEG